MALLSGADGSRTSRAISHTSISKSVVLHANQHLKDDVSQPADIVKDEKKMTGLHTGFAERPRKWHASLVAAAPSSHFLAAPTSKGQP